MQYWIWSRRSLSCSHFYVFYFASCGSPGNIGSTSIYYITSASASNFHHRKINQLQRQQISIITSSSISPPAPAPIPVCITSARTTITCASKSPLPQAPQASAPVPVTSTTAIATDSSVSSSSTAGDTTLITKIISSNFYTRITSCSCAGKSFYP